jgi:hypothetical protein
VVDSLRKSVKIIHLEAISTYETNVKERVKSAQETNAFFMIVKLYLEKEPTWMKYEGYQLLNDGLITYKGRFYISNCDDLKRFMMDELHKIPYIGHPGYQRMITATRKLFYFPGLKKDIIDYLAKCLECQKVKEEHRHQHGFCNPYQFQNGNGKPYPCISSQDYQNRPNRMTPSWWWWKN